MENTYCGKSCAECAEREQLGCPGCRAGPGRYLTGECDCPIVACCNENRLLSCAACEKRENCFKHGRREQIPEDRMHTRLKEKKELVWQGKRLAPRLVLLCIVLLLQFALTLLSLHDWGAILDISSETLFNYLDASMRLFLGFILLSAGFVNNTHFVKAGVWMLVSAILSLILYSIPSPFVYYGRFHTTDSTRLVLTVFFSLTADIAWIAAVYHELLACADAIEPHNSELAAKWRRLWFWFLGLHIAYVLFSVLLSEGQAVWILDYLTIEVLVILLGLAVLIVVDLIVAARLIRTIWCLNDQKPPLKSD